MIRFGGMHEDTLSLTHTLLRSSPEKYTCIPGFHDSHGDVRDVALVTT